MIYVIEHGVAIPAPRRPGRKAPLGFPFSIMKRGESFFVPGRVVAVNSAMYDFQRQHPGRKFTTRYLETDAIHQTAGIRVWRIA